MCVCVCVSWRLVRFTREVYIIYKSVNVQLVVVEIYFFFSLLYVCFAKWLFAGDEAEMCECCYFTVCVCVCDDVGGIWFHPFQAHLRDLVLLVSLSCVLCARRRLDSFLYRSF